jgi:hypothetical protein
MFRPSKKTIHLVTLFLTGHGASDRHTRAAESLTGKLRNLERKFHVYRYLKIHMECFCPFNFPLKYKSIANIPQQETLLKTFTFLLAFCPSPYSRPGRTGFLLPAIRRRGGGRPFSFLTRASGTGLPNCLHYHQGGGRGSGHG